MSWTTILGGLITATTLTTAYGMDRNQFEQVLDNPQDVIQIVFGEEEFEANGLTHPVKNWEVTRTSDPMTDEMITTLTTYGDTFWDFNVLNQDPDYDATHDPNNYVSLNLECRDGEPTVYIDWRVPIVSDLGELGVAFSNGKNVLTRVGEQEPTMDLWGSNETYTWFPDNSESLMREMATSETYTARTRPSQIFQATTVTFDMRGINDVLPEIAEACDWN